MGMATDQLQATETCVRAGRASGWRWIASVVVMLAAFVAASCGDGDDETDRVAVATDLADSWVQAWNDNDPEMMGSVLTADGVYDDNVVFEETGRTFSRDEAIELVQEQGPGVTDVRRVGNLTVTNDGTFTFGCQFTVLGSQRSTTVEIELDGDLASRIEFLSSETVET